MHGARGINAHAALIERGDSHISCLPAMASDKMTIGDAIRGRKAVKVFAPTPVPDETLAEILRLTQRAPSAFNTQPYVCIVVRNQAVRDALAPAMLHANGAKVKNAPVVVVFAADLGRPTACENSQLRGSG